MISKRTILILIGIICTVGCKKDPKKTVTPTPDTVTDTTTEVQKSYQFFSTTKELEILYQSDAWRMVLNDAKKIGLHQTLVAKLDSIYLIHYALINTKPHIFDQRMDALPAFKNFKEMSQSLTGIPLDYHEELTSIFSMQQKTVTANSNPHMILYYNVSDTEENVFSQMLRQKAIVKKFEDHLKSKGIWSCNIYQQNTHLYAVLTSSENTVLEQLHEDLHWNHVWDQTELNSIKKSSAQWKGSAPIFKNWQKMAILSNK